MENDEGKQAKGFKVEDRRRFSESGEARPAAETARPAAAPHPAPEAPSATQSARGAPPEPGLPLNFSTFVISLSTQALAHLGEIPHPIDNQTVVDLGAAQQLIDILGMLKEKTKGNLDATESGLLDSILYDLRLRYVERVRRPA